MTKTFLVLHGLGGSPNENWFPWIKKYLENQNCNVIVPQLPNAENPDSDEWNKAILNLNLDWPNTTIIGHSLGGCATIKLLYDNAIRLHQAVIIASPLSDVGWKTLEKYFSNFCIYPLDRIEKCTLLYSHDDPYVPIEHGRILQTKIVGSELVEYKNKGHFNSFERFSELLELI